MAVKELKEKSEKEIMDFIREKLSFNQGIMNSIRDLESKEVNKHHIRFDMSGYEFKTGQCTIWNTSVLNEFADLGIYDYTSYLLISIKGHQNFT